MTFAGTFTKIDCRQDGYIEDVQTRSPQDSAAARASVQCINQKATRCVVCLGMFVRVSAVHDVNWYIT